MRIAARLGTVVISLWILPTIALAQLTPGETQIPWWLEYYEYEAEEIKSKLSSVGFLIGNHQIEDCDANWCTIDLKRTETVNLGGQRPMCEDVEIFALPKLPSSVPAADVGATLVGSDLVLAVHAIDEDKCFASSLVIDPGLWVDSAKSVLLQPLDPGQVLPFQVPADNVYPCVSVEAGGATVGWTLLRVDPGASLGSYRPLKLLRSGYPDAGDVATIAGNPNRLPLKVEQGILASSDEDSGGVFGHGLTGSSGSPIFGSSARVLGAAHSAADWWIEDGDCYRPDHSAAPRVFFTRPTGAELDAIPPIGLEVSHPGVALPNPQHVDHYGPPGGPFSNDVLPYRLGAGFSGDPVEWEISPPTGTSLFDFGTRTTQGHLPPGGVIDLTLSSTALAASLDLGSYSDSVTVEDRTYETVDTFVHDLFVGVGSFEIDLLEECRACTACPLCFLGEVGPSGAERGESLTWVLTSRWDHLDQTIEIDAPSWVLLTGPGGVQGSSITFTLEAAQSSQVTAALPPGQEHGTFEDHITFRSTHQAQDMHFVDTLARADLGRTVENRSPQQTVNPGQIIEIPVSNLHFFVPTWVQDLDLCIAVQGSAGFDFALLEYTLISPAGTEVPLDGHQSGGEICWSDELFDPPPPIVARETLDLARFEGLAVNGEWRLRITNEGDDPGVVQTTSVRFLLGQGFPQ